MRPSWRVFLYATVVAALVPLGLSAQTAVQSGANALAQSLTSAGGLKAILGVQDFTATGTITYFWEGEEVQGSAKVLGRAPDQFRVDASLPEGTRSYVVSHGAGALKDTSGNVTPIPNHNTINVGVLTFPYFGILARLTDPSVSFTDMGVGQVESGGQYHLIQTQKLVGPQVDPDGVLSGLTTTVYYLDPSTSLPMGVSDTTHPVETATTDYPHWVYFENYTKVGGIQVPMLIREKVGGQTTWELHLSSISFNTGLTDSNFTM